MKISASTIQFAASHQQSQQYATSETSSAWHVVRPANDNSQSPPTNGQIADLVRISDDARTAQSGEANAIKDGIEAANNDPIIRLIRAMVAMLTGKDVTTLETDDFSSSGSSTTPETQVSTPAAAAPTSRVGYGAEYRYQSSYTEVEHTGFSATGLVRTADGQEIRFDLSLSMNRSYHEESSIRIQVGEARQTKDPLVINFDGNAAQLTSQRFKFDLDADGTAENINFVTGGSGFLALDRNGNGKIDNGSELFGARSGNGFAELAALDSDGNGWIDENDPAYDQLSVWTKNADGTDRLSSLKQANVGAINLAHAATPFALKTTDNALLGQIRSSGIYLKESGAAGSIQQVDLTV